MAKARAHLSRLYGASLVLIGLAMAGGLISAEIADAAPHEVAYRTSVG